VGDARRERAHRGEPVILDALLLQPPLLGEVMPHHEQAPRGAHLLQRGGDIQRDALTPGGPQPLVLQPHRAALEQLLERAAQGLALALGSQRLEGGADELGHGEPQQPPGHGVGLEHPSGLVEQEDGIAGALQELAVARLGLPHLEPHPQVQLHLPLEREQALALRLRQDAGLAVDDAQGAQVEAILRLDGRAGIEAEGPAGAFLRTGGRGEAWVS
jgi:hypothetical protein